MATKRHSKGSPRGGQFAPGDRPNDQRLGTSLTLTKPDEGQTPRAFFDEIAYMASIGPRIESMIAERSHALKDHVAKAQAMHEADQLMFLPEDDPETRDRLTAATSDAREEARTLSNDRFSMLYNCCLAEGGTKERYARIALRNFGLQVRRIKSKPPYYPEGVVATHAGIYSYNFNLWVSGWYESGLSLTVHCFSSRWSNANYWAGILNGCDALVPAEVESSFSRLSAIITPTLRREWWSMALLAASHSGSA